MDFQRLITSNIKKLRLERGLTQEQFGDILPDVLCRYDTNPASKVDALRLINSELNRLNIQQLKQILDIAKTFPK